VARLPDVAVPPAAFDWRQGVAVAGVPALAHVLQPVDLDVAARLAVLSRISTTSKHTQLQPQNAFQNAHLLLK
jgi:hypothetical protein